MKNDLFHAASVSPEEIARFSGKAGAWWDKNGPYRALHDLTPLRLEYVKRAVGAHAPSLALNGARVLDIGCGGGLMAEAMAREGASVVGVDASEEAIETARAHALQEKMSLDYRVSTAEALAEEGERFDVILALEIIEHVADRDSFFRALSTPLKPDGLLVVATLNRTRLSFLLGIVMAEYVLGWVPPGTHDWEKFMRPSEMARKGEENGLRTLDVTGLAYSPLRRAFYLSKGKNRVNYFLTARKTGPCRKS